MLFVKKAAPVDFSNLEKLIIYRLRTMTESEYKQLPNISEGIENRLRNVSLNATNLEELFDKIKTKRYPNSRLRRLVLRAFASYYRKRLFYTSTIYPCAWL